MISHDRQQFFFNTFYILDHIPIPLFKLNISKDDFFPSSHAQLTRFGVKIPSSSLDRWTCTFCFLHTRSPLNLIAMVTLWGEKKWPLIMPRNHSCSLWICAQAPWQRNKNHRVNLATWSFSFAVPARFVERAGNHWHSAAVTLWPTYRIKLATC